MAAAGMGPPPADYAVLMLGSAARGESLLSADQDHAILFADSGAAPDGGEAAADDSDDEKTPLFSKLDFLAERIGPPPIALPGFSGLARRLALRNCE